MNDVVVVNPYTSQFTRDRGSPDDRLHSAGPLLYHSRHSLTHTRPERLWRSSSEYRPGSTLAGYSALASAMACILDCGPSSSHCSSSRPCAA